MKGHTYPDKLTTSLSGQAKQITELQKNFMTPLATKFYQSQIFSLAVLSPRSLKCPCGVVYSPFHKTLPTSSLQTHWISVRFYEMGDTSIPNNVHLVLKNIPHTPTPFTMIYKGDLQLV